MNKKILNATNSAIGNISFKSKLEASVYKTLVEHGFSPQYESQRFVLWKGSKINDIYYTKGSDGHLKLIILKSGILHMPLILFLK